MMAFCVLDEVAEVAELAEVAETVFPELVDTAEEVPTLVSCTTVVAVERDAEDKTWFGQTVKVLLLFAACCSTA
jgi:hypothetical protein